MLVCAAFLSLCVPTLTANADDIETLRSEQNEKYAAALRRLAAQCDEHGLAAQAKHTRAWHVERDPNKFYVFNHADAFVPDELSKPTTKDDRVWLEEFKRLRTAQASWLYEHAQAAAEAKQVALALELIYETLREDPDHGEARRILGYEKVGEKGTERWLTAFEAKQHRSDLVWHDLFGWLPREFVERYERGGRYDGIRWMSADDDARKHETIERGWTVNTAHFRVTTNHSLAEGARLARQLEQLYRVWRQVFAGYLDSPAQAQSWFRAGKLKEPKRPFEVFYFRTRDEYNDYLRRWEPRIEISLGFYSDRQRKSYFFAGDDQDAMTVFHEATHQLFSEARATRKDCGEDANFWAIEGVACYMESLARGGGDSAGYWTVGGADAGRLPAARIRLLRDKFYIPFDKLTAMGRADLQTNPDIRTIYSQISGQAAFFMHAGGGCYRDDFTDYLLETYTTARVPATLLEKFMRKKYAQLDAEYSRYIEKLALP